MFVTLLKVLGLKFLAKKIAKILMDRVVYKEIRELAAKSENTVDDEIAEVVIETIDSAIDKF